MQTLSAVASTRQRMRFIVNASISRMRRKSGVDPRITWLGRNMREKPAVCSGRRAAGRHRNSIQTASRPLPSASDSARASQTHVYRKACRSPNTPTGRRMPANKAAMPWRIVMRVLRIVGLATVSIMALTSLSTAGPLGGSGLLGGVGSTVGGTLGGVSGTVGGVVGGVGGTLGGGSLSGALGGVGSSLGGTVGGALNGVGGGLGGSGSIGGTLNSVGGAVGGVLGGNGGSIGNQIGAIVNDPFNTGDSFFSGGMPVDRFVTVDPKNDGANANVLGGNGADARIRLNQRDPFVVIGAGRRKKPKAQVNLYPSKKTPGTSGGKKMAGPGTRSRVAKNGMDVSALGTNNTLH